MLTPEGRSPSPDRAAPAASARPSDEGISFDQIFAALRRRMRLIVAAVALGTGLAALAGYQMTPRYTATALVMFDPKHSDLLDVLDRTGAGGALDPAVVQTEIELINSRSNLGRVMDELSLFDDPAFRPLVAPEADDGPQVNLPGPLAAVASYLPDSWLFAAGFAEERLTPTEAAQPTLATHAAVDRFRQGLDVQPVGQSLILAIGYTATDPDKAARLANAVADAYAETRVEGKRGAVGRAASWLERRLAELEEAVRVSEKAVAEFRAAKGLGVSGVTLSDERLADLNQQLIAARAERLAKEAKLERARAGGGQGPEALNAPLIAELRSQEAGLLRQQAELAQTFGERHPSMVDVRAALAEVRARIRSEAEASVRGLRDEVAVLEARERAIAEDMEKLKQEHQLDRLAEVRLRELEREAESNRQAYQEVLARLNTAQEQEEILGPDVRVISPAVPPGGPSTPGPAVFAAVGSVVSLMLGCFAAFLLERLDRRVRSAASIENAFGVSVLGLVPRLPKRAARRPDRHIVDRPFSGYAESARSILTALRMSDHGLASPVLLITSALPEEGKTTLSISLAAMAAHSGLRVLLIDLDLRRPALGRRLGEGAGGAGLVDYLNGRLPREELIRRDPRSGIDYIAVGRPPTNPVELLQSPELRHLIETARWDYDHVILDCAPLLAVTDAKVAARLADRVILAARWQHTDVEAVGYAVRALHEARVELAGCVVSVVDMGKYKLYATDPGSYYRRYQRYYLN